MEHCAVISTKCTLTGREWRRVATVWPCCHNDLLEVFGWAEDDTSWLLRPRSSVLLTDQFCRFLCKADDWTVHLENHALLGLVVLLVFVHSGVKTLVGTRWRTGLSDLQDTAQQWQTMLVNGRHLGIKYERDNMACWFCFIPTSWLIVTIQYHSLWYQLILAQ